MSTTWHASAAIVMLGGALLAAAPADVPVDVRPVIAAWCVEQLGAGARIAVEVHTMRAEGGRVDGATAEAGARLGRPARFRLTAQGRQAGYALATVTATLSHLRVVAPVSAGGLLTGEDVALVDGEPGQVLLEPLPGAELIGVAFAARRLAAGETVTAAAVRVPHAVRSGQAVRVTVRVGEIVADGTATAVQSGTVGDTIRLVNTHSRRQLRGRIVAAGHVEVLHGF